MLHLLIIALFIVIALHDSVAGGGRFGVAPETAPATTEVWVVTLGPMLTLALGTVVSIKVLARRVAERGSMRALAAADRVLAISRVSALLLHAGNVLALGWMGAVRGVVGDVVAIDELLAIAPPLLVVIVGWWAYFPIEARVRESTMYRLLETGQPQYPMVSRGRFVMLQLRHQILLTLVPLSMIAIWSEGLERGLSRMARADPERGPAGRIGAWLADDANLTAAQTLLQLAGVVIIFALSPLVLRRVWDTVRLTSGPLHDRLMRLCRASGVSIRGLLVWRTHGTMLNGAVIGLVGPLRYILLTDALLDQLPERQIEAVMAHEIGHARHAHMPWLAGSLLAGFGGVALLVGTAIWGGLLVIDAAGHGAFAEWLAMSSLLTGGMAVCSFAGALTVFGFVSRRFEWQADAFAVQQLSRAMEAETGARSVTTSAMLNSPGIISTVDPRACASVISADANLDMSLESPAATVRPEAVAAMVGALDSVATLNHLSRARFTWRHGSIAYRQRRLLAMSGRPLGPQRIDGISRWLKRAVAIGLVLLVTMFVLESTVLRGGDGRDDPSLDSTRQHAPERGRR
ncbi:MAG: M48 family metalloprotease [Phycisphaerales bacterium]|nr:M48 family metalloprotease [Phycisphaerales bacterium]